MVVSFLDLCNAIPAHAKQIGHVRPTSFVSIRVTVLEAVHAMELFVFLLYGARYMNMENTATADTQKQIELENRCFCLRIYLRFSNRRSLSPQPSGVWRGAT